MVNSCNEVALGWLEGIIGGEVNIQEEDSTSIWTVILKQLIR